MDRLLYRLSTLGRGLPVRAAVERLLLLPRRRSRLEALAAALPAATDSDSTPDEDAPTVALLTFRPWPVHQGWELVFTRLLQRGAHRWSGSSATDS